MKYGIEGYGLYFACVEIIAGNLKAENVTFELEHDAEILAHKFKVDTIKVEKMMKYMVELKLFEYNIENGRIICLQLAKRLDNHMSRNPEIKKIVDKATQLRSTLADTTKKRIADNIRLDEIRLDENIINKEGEEEQVPFLDKCIWYHNNIKKIKKPNTSYFYCKSMRGIGLCTHDDKFCSRLFNEFNNDMKVFRESKTPAEYYGTWTNQMKSYLGDEKGKIRLAVKKKFKEQENNYGKA